MTQELARKTVKLGRAGGSRTIVLPKAWLEEMAVGESVDLVRTNRGIVIEAARQTAASIEDEPEFAQFLEFLSRASLAEPEELINVVALMAGDEQLFEGVELDLDTET
jgi:antitoxin component of MazEF toxin-antitoxin module